MGELVSVIIPIYNVEEYLRESLDSVIEQSYTNIEVILVDDGSLDGSGEICDQYAAQDPRIKVLHLPNGGVSKARRLGYESSTGEYVAFVDPDDRLPHDAIKLLCENMSYEFDIVVGSSTRFYQSGKVKRLIYKAEVVKDDEWLRRLIHITPEYIGVPWGRIFRRELFVRESFSVLKRAQDLVMNIEVATRLRSVKIIPSIVYNYRAPFGVRKVYQPDLEYLKLYLGKIRTILIQNGLYGQYAADFHSMQLFYIHRCILRESYINGEDEWIKKLCREVDGETLTYQQRAILASLQSISAQKRLRRISKLMRFGAKILKLVRLR
ncbi:MAG: glycosyltransferase [Rikenellaceae bacterium]